MHQDAHTKLPLSIILAWHVCEPNFLPIGRTFLLVLLHPDDHKLLVDLVLQTLELLIAHIQYKPKIISNGRTHTSSGLRTLASSALFDSLQA